MSETLVQKLLKRTCITIHQKDNIRTFLQQLVENNIGAIPVINSNDELTGIVSERDVVRNITEQKLTALLSQPVLSIMTPSVIVCDQYARADTLMELMTKNRVRHIPIVNKNIPIGIVSIGDVVNRLLEKYKEETQLLRSFISS